jgi:Glutathione S-transferase, N-terminal domain
VDTSKGEQHMPAFRAINPNGKVPAIVDTDGPSGKEVRVDLMIRYSRARRQAPGLKPTMPVKTRVRWL